MDEVVRVAGRVAVMTVEEGTMSGLLDVAVTTAGRGLVRYRDTDTWLTVGTVDGDPSDGWATAADLAAAIEDGAGVRDAAGNAVPFEG